MIIALLDPALTVRPVRRKDALVKSVTTKAPLEAFTMVTPTPWPWTVMFLFDHDTLELQVKVPDGIFTTSPSTAEFTLEWQSDWEPLQFRTVAHISQDKIIHSTPTGNRIRWIIIGS